MSLPNLLPYLILGAVACSAGLALIVQRVAVRVGAVDRPTGGRKIHRVPTALWGGLVTGTVIVAALGVLIYLLPFETAGDLTPELHAMQLWGVMFAIGLLMLGGALDDQFDLHPAIQFLFPLFASLIVVATGSGITQVTNPGGAGAISLVWSHLTLGPFAISLPADLITIVWLLAVTYAMKFLDGLDGLAAGMAAIGAVLIAALASSDAYFQPLVATLALMVAAAHIGFLPFNRQGFLFLGEAGSTIAGFTLGVLAIISGAKVATAATALAIPLVDIVIVVMARILAGRSPFKGDASHLHFRLLEAGLSPGATVRLLWAVALTFGIVALTLQTRGKLFLFGGLVLLICLVSAWVWWKARKRS